MGHRETLQKYNEERAKKQRKMRSEDALAIVACIKKASPKHIKSTEIAEELGLPRQRIWHIISDIKDTYPEIVSHGSAGYVWEDDNNVPTETESDDHVETSEPEHEDLNHNAEGYKDPTAAAILKRFEQPNNKVRAGEIWSTGNEDLYFLILATFPGLIVGLNICKIDTWFDPEWDVRILIGKDQYYINIKRLTSRPAKTIVANYGRIDKNRLNLIRASIGGMLNLKTVEEKIVEKPVEVIREVVKEVPVEKIVEKPVEVEKVIFKTKFDRKKLRRVGLKVNDVGKYQKLVENARDDALYWKHRHEVVLTRAEAWERAFRMMATGKNA